MKNIILKPFIIEPSFKFYDWGSYSSIQDVTGRKELQGKAAAEMWMGDHHSGPNMIKNGDKNIPLHDLVESEPEKLIGKGPVGKFGSKIPFLFKLLASEKPLSIQAHPSKKQAEEGFERENILKTAMDDFTRGYKDRNHKPEIIMALTDFKMMKGFRSYSEIKDNFCRYCKTSCCEIFNKEEKISDERKIKIFFKKMMSLSRNETLEMINEAVKSAKENNRGTIISEFIIKFAEFYPGDGGILSPLYLNCTVLSKGESVYIPAGEMHAYVEGTGMELMANSDNVFRGGLTSKHIDREELYKILKYKSTEINKIERTAVENESFFYTESDEFLLSEIIINKEKNYISGEDRNIDILLCYEGGAEIKVLNNGFSIKAEKGECFAVPSCAGQYSMTGDGVFYKATVPL